MLKGHFEDVPAVAPQGLATPATVRWLISRRDGAPGFAMRVIELARTGDRIPLHRHAYEHEIFILEGDGLVLEPSGGEVVRPGSFLYVAPGEEHGFENAGTGPFRFICVIPEPPA